MNKVGLINKLVENGMPCSEAIHAVGAVITAMADTLSTGESIYLRGLGTFRVKEAKEKQARNITAGTPITVPAHKTVKFILSKKIKDALK